MTHHGAAEYIQYIGARRLINVALIDMGTRTPSLPHEQRGQFCRGWLWHHQDSNMQLSNNRANIFWVASLKNKCPSCSKSISVHTISIKRHVKLEHAYVLVSCVLSTFSPSRAGQWRVNTIGSHGNDTIYHFLYAAKFIFNHNLRSVEMRLYSNDNEWLSNMEGIRGLSSGSFDGTDLKPSV